MTAPTSSFVASSFSCAGVTRVDFLVDADGDGALGTLSHVLEAGNLGHARIPGKHGAAPAAYEVVSVVVPNLVDDVDTMEDLTRLQLRAGPRTQACLVELERSAV